MAFSRTLFINRPIPGGEGKSTVSMFSVFGTILDVGSADDGCKCASVDEVGTTFEMLVNTIETHYPITDVFPCVCLFLTAFACAYGIYVFARQCQVCLS